MILTCIQCVFSETHAFNIYIQCLLNLYLMCIQALAAYTFHFSETNYYNNGAARSAKSEKMILICIQCVLNVYSMYIQALAANTSHFSKTKDYNNGSVRSA